MIEVSRFLMLSYTFLKKSILAFVRRSFILNKNHTFSITVLQYDFLRLKFRFFNNYENLNHDSEFDTVFECKNVVFSSSFGKNPYFFLLRVRDSDLKTRFFFVDLKRSCILNFDEFGQLRYHVKLFKGDHKRI